MQSLNQPVALAITRDRQAAAARRRAFSPPGRDPAPPGRPARAETGAAAPQTVSAHPAMLAGVRARRAARWGLLVG